MKSLLLLLVALVFASFVMATPVQNNKKYSLGASGIKEPSNSKAVTMYCRVFSLPDSSGNYLDISDYVPDLSSTGIDNDIESVSQTGMWMYYENVDYNAVGSGSVYFVHGVEINFNFPAGYSNMASSIRYAGDALSPNADSWTLYEGQFFTGNEYYGSSGSISLGYLDNDASSLILTGVSPWTLYSGQGYTGDRLCVYPDTDHDVGPQGDVLDFGIYPDITSLGIPDNAVRSVRKGCWANKIAKATPVKVEGRSKNGAWGYFDL